MGKVLRKRMAGLYVVVVCILLLSFYTVTFQAASRQSGCQGDDKESCPLQQERRNFQRLFERGSFPNSGGNFKNLSQRKASYEEDSLDFAERNIALKPENYEAVEFLDNDLKKVGEHSTISKKSSKIFPLVDADDSFMDNDPPRGLNEQRALTRKSLSGNPSEVKQSKSQVLNIKQEGTFGHHTEVKQGKSQVLNIKQEGTFGHHTEVKQGKSQVLNIKQEGTFGHHTEVKQSKSQVLNIKQEGTFGHHTEVKQGKSQVLNIKHEGASLGNPTEVKQGNIPDFKPKPERTVGIREFPPLYRPVLPNGLNCSRVWHGDGQETRRAMQEMNDTSAARRPPGFYGTITDNCQLYRKQNGFILNVSQEEREFPLAFSMMVYKEPEQLERLLRAVYRPHNAYCVHADLKTKPDVLQQIRAIIKCLPNVIESPRQIDVKWGKFSVLEPELICMQALWRMRSKWKYLINLTGQEFPLKTNKELVKILTAYKGANDILGERPKERNKWRWQKAKSPPPHNITVAKGPVHVAASRGFVDFLLHYSYARDFLAWTKRTAIPDETFFATLNNMHQFGVPGSYTGNITSKRRIMLNRFKIWDTSNRTCSGKFLRNICHFGLAEVADLSRSRHFVANKFSYDFYPLAYDCTEQWYFDRVRREEKTGVADIDTRYYSNLELVKHAYRGSAGNGP